MDSAVFVSGVFHKSINYMLKLKSLIFLLEVIDQLNHCNDNLFYFVPVNEITLDRDQVQERLSKTQAELFVLRGRCSVLTEECDRLKSDLNQKIPVSVHKAAVDECKR